MKKKLTSYGITKKINDMRFYVDKIYNNFYNISTDSKMRKQIEEYIQFKKMEKIRRINFIKNLRQYFKQKINKDIDLKSKSVKNIFDMKILYSQVINTIKMQDQYTNKYKPYLFPIRKEEIIRINCVTEFGLIYIVRKIKENYLLKLKRKKMSIKKLNTIKSTNNFNSIKRKSGTILIKPKTINDQRSTQNLLSEKNNKIFSPFPPSKYSSASRRNYNFNTNKINFRINSSNSSSRNKNVFQNYNNFMTKKSSKIRKIRIKSLLEVKKTAYKILPFLSSSFNLTLKKSRDLKKQIYFFQKVATMRTESSKRKKQRILKNYFHEHNMPSIKSSLANSKKKYLLSNVTNKYISIKRNGSVKLKFNLLEKQKSPLIFVEDYNKLRNRRRKNNKNIENNLGLGIYSAKNERRIKKKELFLGMYFNYIKKVNT